VESRQRTATDDSSIAEQKISAQFSCCLVAQSLRARFDISTLKLMTRW
jgi:hypothetical protein